MEWPVLGFWAQLVAGSLAILGSQAFEARYDPIPRQAAWNDCGLAVAKGIADTACVDLAAQTPALPLTMHDLAALLAKSGLHYAPVAVSIDHLLAPIAVGEPIILLLSKPNPHYVLTMGLPSGIALGDSASGRRVSGLGALASSYSGYALVPVAMEYSARENLRGSVLRAGEEAQILMDRLLFLGGAGRREIAKQTVADRRKLILGWTGASEGEPLFDAEISLARDEDWLSWTLSLGTSPSIFVSIERSPPAFPIEGWFSPRLAAWANPGTAEIALSGSYTLPADPLLYRFDLAASARLEREPPSLQSPRPVSAGFGLSAAASAGFLLGDDCYLEVGMNFGVATDFSSRGRAAKAMLGSTLALRLPAGGANALVGLELAGNSGERGKMYIEW